MNFIILLLLKAEVSNKKHNSYIFLDYCIFSTHYADSKIKNNSNFNLFWKQLLWMIISENINHFVNCNQSFYTSHAKRASISVFVKRAFKNMCFIHKKHFCPTVLKKRY